MAVVEESTTIGQYRLLERLGAGGMAEVWRARDRRLDRDIALKLLAQPLLESPHRRARFEQEARALAALAHPNIVTIHTIDEIDGHHFLAMELVDGISLREVLRTGALQLERFFELAVPIGEALGAAHERGVIHGDLKPANVMISHVGVVKIVDFGLALLREPGDGLDPAELPTLEAPQQAETIAGTVPYMAPELLHGQPPDPASDLFALGTVLYEMATGTHPFGSTNSAETLAAILRDDPVPPSALRSEIPPRLDRMILRTLRKEPLRRTRRAFAMVDQLRSMERSLGTVARHSIAVLPFAAPATTAGRDYFGSGIAEEILSALAQVRGLRVAPRASSFALDPLRISATEVRERLGVDVVLFGTVRRDGDRLRLHTELVDGRDGCPLWSRTYERRASEVFGIQERIAESVARQLRVTLSPHERRALRQVATQDAEAYDYYLRARRYHHQFRRKGMEFALRMYSRAIEIDPSFARAYAGIAQCAAFLYLTYERDDRLRQRAERASRQALALDPQLPESQSARGVALSIAGRHAEAERAFETAIRLDPDLFEVHYTWARQAFSNGQADRAIELYERASELMPDDYQSPLLMAQIYDDLDRPVDARAARVRGVGAARARLDLYPDDVRALYMGANGLVGLGERGEGLEWAAQARRLEPDETLTLYNLACVYALAGEGALAIDCLTHAVENGFAHVDWLEQDSNLDSLREEPRFRQLTAAMRTTV